MDRRNLGLDFLKIDEKVNGLLVWVNRKLSAEESNYFQWEVYVSQNNLNWTLWRTVTSAPFGPFENRFEVLFPSASTRYIKVAVVPLSRTFVGASDIFVTELQATLTLPAEEAGSRSSTTSQNVNLAAQARILDNPSLFYNFSLFHTRTEPSSVSRTSISNWLTLQRRINPWLTATAQTARDDVEEPAGKQHGYRYSAAFYATPLRNLYQSMIYSGSTTRRPEGTAVQNNLSLNNRATLYPGVSVSLNGGVSDGRQETGEKTRSYLFNFGSGISPHPTMTWNIGGSANRSEVSGGNKADQSSYLRRAYASVGWNPLPAVNLFGSADVVDRDDKMTRLQSWSVNWSPFRDGALQMSLAHSEQIRSQDDGSDQLTNVNLRWDVRPGVFTDLSYGIIKSETRIQETRTRSLSANLHASF
jgi:hypothetical protein